MKVSDLKSEVDASEIGFECRITTSYTAKCLDCHHMCELWGKVKATQLIFLFLVRVRVNFSELLDLRNQM